MIASDSRCSGSIMTARSSLSRSWLGSAATLLLVMITFISSPTSSCWAFSVHRHHLHRSSVTVSNQPTAASVVCCCWATTKNNFHGQEIGRCANQIDLKRWDDTQSDAVRHNELSQQFNTIIVTSRRNAMVGSLAVLLSVPSVMSEPQVASASGGATAGRYTTIPIAKRRYYGRVQQAVHDFLLMGTDFTGSKSGAGDALKGPNVQHFFDPNGVVVVAARRQDISGQCTKKDSSCQGKEVRDSRYHDMKASMYLLANAFRTDQQKAPDRLPTVKAAKAFFQQMNELEKLALGKKSSESASNAATEKYAAALDILDEYLDLVELPPTESGHYDKEFDTLVGETARIT